jgi:hypothetical protein
MFKILGASIIAASLLAGCGGGGDTPAKPAAKTLSLSFYGLPLQGSQTTAHAAVMRAAASDTTASAPVASSDASATTVQSLQDALAAQGVTANVTAQVMDGTTLHAIVMGENNGLPPTPDQFGKDPSEWLIVNFQLDDMVTPWTDTNQQAAVSQFANDLAVFVNRAHVSGKQVFVVAPIQPCASIPTSDIVYGLYSAITQAGNSALMYTVGGLSNTLSTSDHMGADCRTPDTYLLNLRTTAVATDIAARYKGATAQ